MATTTKKKILAKKKVTAKTEEKKKRVLRWCLFPFHTLIDHETFVKSNTDGDTSIERMKHEALIWEKIDDLCGEIGYDSWELGNHLESYIKESFQGNDDVILVNFEEIHGGDEGLISVEKQGDDVSFRPDRSAEYSAIIYVLQKVVLVVRSIHVVNCGVTDNPNFLGKGQVTKYGFRPAFSLPPHLVQDSSRKGIKTLESKEKKDATD